MRRYAKVLPAIVLLLAFAVPSLAAPTPKDNPKPKGDNSPEFIRKMLDARVNIEFAGIALNNALAQLSEDHKVNLVLDEAAVRAMGMEPNDIMLNCKIKDVKLRAGLRTMLAQYNLTVAIVGESVLVTTEDQAIYKQLKHRISVDYDNVPLGKALKELAQANGVNVVIDPRTNKTKASDAPVSLTVDDVPFEAVVRLMCEMGGLKPARMGNVIFVTTEDRADKLKDSDSLVPNPNIPGVPGGVPGFPGGIIPGLGGGVAPVPAPAVPPIAPGVAPAPPAVPDMKAPAAVPEKVEPNPK